ncbi:DUF5919 domain-containing protein [Nocardia mangyaensis]|uniref:DUF5919 domain-containing protein n=1 Tax=Nocardia mangyaensis TaxID=2213200 RepID=UPI002674E64F|nr:DUF5919 domain-containing protein [Nocardia mangyaensis]MDO3650849.1 DUF5919 domain-containing protein [Nocardia mangyaensis]
MKVLLQSKHLQTHGAFDREYNAVARRVEPALVGSGPRKAQFYRWLSGSVTGLPYPHHCRILEAMFPDYTAGQLFAEYAGAQYSSTRKVRGGGSESLTTYATRSELLRNLPPTELFSEVKKVDLVGISLNLFCQQYPDSEIVELLRSGAQIRCLFLQPDSRHTADREREEGQPAGALTALTGLNISALHRINQQVVAENAVGTLMIRTYDAPARFNITIVDRTCVYQPYLPTSRGVESPAFVVDSDSSGLYATFSGAFETLWASGAEPVDDRR